MYSILIAEFRIINVIGFIMLKEWNLNASQEYIYMYIQRKRFHWRP
jgi:hypothetical protein